jgi:hypothetical protein
MAAVLAGCEDVTQFVDSNLGTDLAATFGAEKSVEITQDQPMLQARFRGTSLVSATPDVNEIALTLSTRADAQLFADLQRRAPDWIIGTQVSGNTAIVVARDDATFSAAPVDDGFLLSIAHRSVPALADNADALRGEEESAKPEAVPDGMQMDNLRAAFGN